MRIGTVPPKSEMVKRYRADRGWSQDELASRVGCSKRTIENVEAGRPVYLRTIAEIAGAFGPPVTVSDLIEGEGEDDSTQGNSTDLTATAEPIGNAPPLPSLLVGRDSDLAILTQKLCGPVSAGRQPATQVLTAMRGWPGIGKTTMARALCHCQEVANAFPEGVLWASLGPTPSILVQLHAWGRALSDRDVSTTKNVEEASYRLACLLRHRRMLLVVDDAWDASHAIPFLIGGRSCAMLVTTRLTCVADAISPTPDDVYRLDVLTNEESLKLLSTLAPHAVESHVEECRELVRQLEGLPLALQVAGRMLRAEHARGWSVANLLQELRRDSAKILDARAPADVAVSSQVSPTVAALLQRSTDLLEPSVRRRFARLAPFAPRPATFELNDLMAVWRVDEKIARETVDVLVDRGLLEPTGDGDYQIHQVIVEHARTLLDRSR